MERSKSIKELATALAKAQGDIGFAMKDTANPFFKSKYADLASVVGAIKESLAKYGLSFTQISHDAEHAVCVETIILHASGEWISNGKLTVPVAKNDAQGFGSAMTYARRYSLSAAFGVAPEEDDGNAATKAKPEPAKAVTKDVFDSLPIEEQEFLTGIAMDTIALLDDGRIEDAVKFIDGKRLDADEKTALWSRFNSQQRTAMKKAAEAMKTKPLTDNEQPATQA